MDDPGIFALLNSSGEDFTIAGAGTQIGAVAGIFAGLQSLALQARFAYGSGGTNCRVYVQTSLDQGTTWFDVACLAFATAGLTRITNLTTQTTIDPPQAPTDGALADNSILDGPLGDRFRAKVISVGDYSGPTVLSLRGCAR